MAGIAGMRTRDMARTQLRMLLHMFVAPTALRGLITSLVSSCFLVHRTPVRPTGSAAVHSIPALHSLAYDILCEHP